MVTSWIEVEVDVERSGSSPWPAWTTWPSHSFSDSVFAVMCLHLISHIWDDSLCYMGTLSGIGVLDKAFSVVDALEAGPLSLAGLVDATGLPRATAHRLAAALEVHGLVRRDDEGRFATGPRLTGLDLPVLAAPALERLRDGTGESAQLYVRRGDRRVCVASLESPTACGRSWRWGPRCPSTSGRPARSFAATRRRGAGGGPRASRSGARRGVGQRPVHGPAGEVVAAVSVSGPIERTSRSPGERYADAVMEAARAIERQRPLIQVTRRQASSRAAAKASWPVTNTPWSPSTSITCAPGIARASCRWRSVGTSLSAVGTTTTVGTSTSPSQGSDEKRARAAA